MATKSDPGVGQAPLPAADAAELLRRNGTDPDLAGRDAIRAEGFSCTYAEYYRTCCRWANLFLQRKVEGQPFHVAVLMENIPEYLFALGGAALSGAAVVGINHTRRGEHLLHDVRHTDCGLLVAEGRLLEYLDPVADQLDDLLVVGDTLEPALAAVSDDDPHVEVELSDPWTLIFTSGTSAAPKAVVCSQRRILTTGTRMGMLMGVGPDDVGYVSMPLFHSNAIMVGWASGLVAGATVALAPKFTASGWLPDIRRYGATYFNYTGKPLAYLLAQPEKDDDADNPLRVAYGNEGASELVAAFAKRFGVEVIDGFGATEGGIGFSRTESDPAGSVGRAGPEIRVVDAEGNELPRATFDEHGTLIDPEGCVGEIVNVSGVGVFEGYYNNDEANARATRNGWYWSGDLGYLDAEGFLYFAGRTADWLRVDGENFPAGPIEVIVGRHPDVLACAVYGVPDVEAGDRVMAALVLRDGATFDPAAFAAWVDAQADLGPKWRPTYVRVTEALPVSPTNKVLVRTLVHQKYRFDRVEGDALWVRDRGADAYRRFGEEDADGVHASLESSGRGRFWDL